MNINIKKEEILKNLAQRINSETEPVDEDEVPQVVTPAEAVAVCYYQKPDSSRQEEFILLINSANINTVSQMSGRINRNDSATFITTGRLQKLQERVLATGAKYVFVDWELSGIQLRNLKTALKIEVIDRTGLILSIFSQRARSQAGKMQVELAQLQYKSTHLVREWSHLERQRGGLGKTGGPGEKQLELDRRMIGDKIKKLRKELAVLGKQRQSQRKQRSRRGAFTIALVGYTNTGKSTLFNVLTKANSLEKNQLFASLDPMARRCFLPDLPPEQNVIALDTVGFVRDLPHSLVEAFHSTLEETRLADLLLIIGDISGESANERYRDVDKVLSEIGVADIPRILVWNKIDLLQTPPPTMHKEINNQFGINTPSIFISARNKIGIEELKKLISKYLLDFAIEPHSETSTES